MNQGENVTLQCHASHDPTMDLTFTWALNGVLLDLEDPAGPYHRVEGVRETQVNVNSACQGGGVFVRRSLWSPLKNSDSSEQHEVQPSAEPFRAGSAVSESVSRNERENVLQLLLPCMKFPSLAFTERSSNCFGGLTCDAHCLRQREAGSAAGVCPSVCKLVVQVVSWIQNSHFTFSQCFLSQFN